MSNLVNRRGGGGGRRGKGGREGVEVRGMGVKDVPVQGVAEEIEVYVKPGDSEGGEK
jgi:hypothetical protein